MGGSARQMNLDELDSLQFVYWGNELDERWIDGFEAEAGAGPASEPPSSSSDLEVSNDDDVTSMDALLFHAGDVTSSSFTASNLSSGASETPADHEQVGASVNLLIFVDETAAINQHMKARSRGVYETSSGPDDPEYRRLPAPQVIIPDFPNFIHCQPAAKAGERLSASTGAVPPKPPSASKQKRRSRMNHLQHSDDGYQWAKYGQKTLQTGGAPQRRHYFRCTFDGCTAKKTTTSMIGANNDDAFIPNSMRYSGKHNHSLNDLDSAISGRLVRVKACSPEPGPDVSQMDTFHLTPGEGSE